MYFPFLADKNRSATTTNEAPDSGWSRGNTEAASLIVVEVSKSPRASLAVVTLIDIVL
ncbi:hypothetical protein FM113_13780 [Leucobacter sp. 7(1)]|nr:hypothetical protein FM113_13780 [Leucobacter sp. 7(1)]